jgi:hypothetical protein
MTHQEQEAVKSLLNGKAWLLVEAMMLEELSRTMKVDITATYETIAVNTIASVKINEMVNTFLGRLNNIKNGVTNTPTSYK